MTTIEILVCKSQKLFQLLQYSYWEISKYCKCWNS